MGSMRFCISVDISIWKKKMEEELAVERSKQGMVMGRGKREKRELLTVFLQREREEEDPESVKGPEISREKTRATALS